MAEIEVMMTQDGSNSAILKPLEIRIFWDPGFEKGLEFANLIFQNFSKCTDTTKEYDVGIPVNFFTNPDSQIPSFKSKSTLCFLFIDDDFVINKRKWQKTIDCLVEKRIDDNISIIPIKFTESAFRAFDAFEHINFLIPEDNTKNDKFLLAVAYSVYNCLFNIDGQEKVTIPLFLSHYKKSEGRNVCKNIKKCISDSNSSLKVFFDENDIDYGEKFDIVIETNIKNSTLVVIHTDGFSNREFCRREVITAKRFERPIILVDYLKNGENRAFPYLGNVKTIKVEKRINYFKLIFEVLKESIRIEFFKKKNETIIAYFNPSDQQFKITPYAPELLTMSFRKDKRETIVYPNPVLGQEEISILREEFPQKNFLTPILFATTSKKYTSLLNGLSISFSVSETSKIMQHQDIKSRCEEVIGNIYRYLIVCGSKIVYSGSFNYLGINFLEILTNHFSTYKEIIGNDCVNSTEFFDYYYFENKNIDKKDLAKVSVIGNLHAIEAVKTNSSDEVNTAISFSKLRQTIAMNVYASIFIGGKAQNYVGIMPGVLEEFNKAVEQKNAIYLIGAFGGITSDIINLIVNKKKIETITNENLISTRQQFYNDFFEYQKVNHQKKLDFDQISKKICGLNISNLKNGLSDEENLILFESDDSDLIASLILKGLHNRLVALKKR